MARGGGVGVRQRWVAGVAAAGDVAALVAMAAGRVAALPNAVSALALLQVALHILAAAISPAPPGSRAADTVRCALAAAAGLVVGVPLFFLLEVALGARVWEGDAVAGGLALATALSSLGVVQLVVVYRHDWGRAARCLAKPGHWHSSELVVFAPAFGACLGAWASSALLLLDWMRWWQAWPFPCVCGAVLGHLAGCGLALTRSRGSGPRKDV